MPDYSSTQFDLTHPGLLRRLGALKARIRPEDLKEDEADPHVTVLYGLTTDDPEDVRPLARPVSFTLGGLSVFENEDEDVLKLDVEGEDLHALHDELCALPHEETHPTYEPHLTLAYLKPGTGRRYVGRSGLEGTNVRASRLVFSTPDKRRTVFKASTVASKFRVTFRAERDAQKAESLLRQVGVPVESRDGKTLTVGGNAEKVRSLFRREKVEEVEASALPNIPGVKLRPASEGYWDILENQKFVGYLVAYNNGTWGVEGGSSKVVADWARKHGGRGTAGSSSGSFIGIKASSVSASRGGHVARFGFRNRNEAQAFARLADRLTSDTDWSVYYENGDDLVTVENHDPESPVFKRLRDEASRLGAKVVAASISAAASSGTMAYQFPDERAAEQFVNGVSRLRAGLKAAYRGRVAIVLNVAGGPYAAEVSDLARAQGGRPAPGARPGQASVSAASDARPSLDEKFGGYTQRQVEDAFKAFRKSLDAQGKTFRTTELKNKYRDMKSAWEHASGWTLTPQTFGPSKVAQASTVSAARPFGGEMHGQPPRRASISAASDQDVRELVSDPHVTDYAIKRALEDDTLNPQQRAVLKKRLAQLQRRPISAASGSDPKYTNMDENELMHLVLGRSRPLAERKAAGKELMRRGAMTRKDLDGYLRASTVSAANSTNAGTYMFPDTTTARKFAKAVQTLGHEVRLAVNKVTIRSVGNPAKIQSLTSKLDRLAGQMGGSVEASAVSAAGNTMIDEILRVLPKATGTAKAMLEGALRDLRARKVMSPTSRKRITELIRNIEQSHGASVSAAFGGNVTAIVENTGDVWEPDPQKMVKDAKAAGLKAEYSTFSAMEFVKLTGPRPKIEAFLRKQYRGMSMDDIGVEWQASTAPKDLLASEAARRLRHPIECSPMTAVRKYSFPSSAEDRDVTAELKRMGAAVSKPGRGGLEIEITDPDEWPKYEAVIKKYKGVRTR